GSPTQSSANATGRLRTLAIAGATGFRDCAASRPLGRPKWESRITFPPLSATSLMVGATRSMRVRSETRPFSTGTFRSTRMSTRLPLTSTSSSVRNMSAAWQAGQSSRDDPNEKRAHRQRDQISLPIELAGELRQDEPDGLCRASRGWDHVDRRGACPVQVLVHLIERGLVIGVGMHGGHKTLVDADRIIEHLRDRREAVRGARGIGDDLVLPRELVVVDAIDNREVDPVGWCRDDDALGTGGQMCRRFLLRGK